MTKNERRIKFSILYSAICTLHQFLVGRDGDYNRRQIFTTSEDEFILSREDGEGPPAYEDKAYSSRFIAVVSTNPTAIAPNAARPSVM